MTTSPGDTARARLAGAGQPGGRSGVLGALASADFGWDMLCAGNNAAPDATISPEVSVHIARDVAIICTR
jgi:hypothetical protein